MLSSRHSFIYVHVPKTGGNSINRLLLPYSDDELYTEKWHDGMNTFGIRGGHSANKHANLSAYKAYLGEAFDQYRVMISVRHPFPRAVSYYFSPHRWFRERDDGGWAPEEPVWDEDAFFKLIGSKGFRPAVSYLDVDPRPSPDVVIRTESVRADIARACKTLGLPDALADQLPHANLSAAPKGMIKACLASEDLRDEVERRFADDMNVFGYERYQPMSDQQD